MCRGCWAKDPFKIEPLNSLIILNFSILQNSITFSSNDTTKINSNRIIIVSSSLALALSGSYYYIENSWWSEQQKNFHFDQGPDLVYALNVDKAGHFLGGLYAADIFSNSFEWAGLNSKRANLYGAFFASGIQLAIEIKDGYAPHWGFSKWDLILGSAGSFWPVMQDYSKDLKAINFKFSYYRHSNAYFDLEAQRGKQISLYNWQDDYPNQTYWITFDINHFVENCCWPDWLNLAVGFGIDETQYLDNLTKAGGNNEWYIALDYDVPKILKNWKSPTAKKIKYWLNYFHLPSPTIRILPKLEFYPLYL